MCMRLQEQLIDAHLCECALGRGCVLDNFPPPHDSHCAVPCTRTITHAKNRESIINPWNQNMKLLRATCVSSRCRFTIHSQPHFHNSGKISVQFVDPKKMCGFKCNPIRSLT